MDATFDPRPIPWNEFPAECLWYLVPMSVVHLVVFIVVCSLLAILSWGQADKMFRRIGRFGLFMILLLLVGALFNGFWSCTVYGRFYRSSDYVFGFIPFWPLTDIWVESRDAQGHLLKVPYRLHALWMLFTAGTWGVTVVLYRVICGGSLRALRWSQRRLGLES